MNVTNQDIHTVVLTHFSERYLPHNVDNNIKNSKPNKLASRLDLFFHLSYGRGNYLLGIHKLCVVMLFIYKDY